MRDAEANCDASCRWLEVYVRAGELDKARALGRKLNAMGADDGSPRCRLTTWAVRALRDNQTDIVHGCTALAADLIPTEA